MGPMLLLGTDYQPHLQCIYGDPGLVSVDVVSDALIALAYFSIPILLWLFFPHVHIRLMRRQLVWFGLFITLCGLTHIMDIVVIWWPIYWAQAAVLAVTACASLGALSALFDLYTMYMDERERMKAALFPGDPSSPPPT